MSTISGYFFEGSKLAGLSRKPWTVSFKAPFHCRFSTGCKPNVLRKSVFVLVRAVTPPPSVMARKISAGVLAVLDENNSVLQYDDNFKMTDDISCNYYCTIIACC